MGGAVYLMDAFLHPDDMGRQVGRRKTMSLRSTLVIGLIAVSAGAGCATGFGSGSTASGTNGTGGQASPSSVSRDTPQCGGGTSYNRASGLCVGPSGP